MRIFVFVLKLIAFLFLLGVLAFIGLLGYLFVVFGIAQPLAYILLIAYVPFAIWLVYILFKKLFQGKKKNQKILDSQLQTLSGYVRQGKDRGLSKREIYEKLMQLGWEKEMIDSAYKNLEG